MAKHIDLTNKLDRTRPTIIINGIEYEVNDEKSNVLSMNSTLKKHKGDEVELYDKIVEQLIGKKALKEIEELHLGISQYKTIAFALMACVNDEEMEDVEKRFRDES